MNTLHIITTLLAVAGTLIGSFLTLFQVRNPKRKNIFTSVFLILVIGLLVTTIFWQPKISEDNKLESVKYLNSGINEAESGDYNAAISNYKIAIEKNPNNSDAYQFLGYCEYLIYSETKNKENLNQALEHLSKAIQINPQNVWGYYNYSIVLWASNKKTEAMNQIKKLIEIDPSFKKKISRDRQFREFETLSEFRNLIS